MCFRQVLREMEAGKEKGTCIRGEADKDSKGQGCHVSFVPGLRRVLIRRLSRCDARVFSLRLHRRQLVVGIMQSPVQATQALFQVRSCHTIALVCFYPITFCPCASTVAVPPNLFLLHQPLSSPVLSFPSLPLPSL